MFRREATNITNEQDLVRRCKENNAAAQKQLYSMYVADMMILCLRYITNTEEAKEALMDGFYSCFTNMHSFNYRGDGSTKAWLKKIMINQCLTHLRRRQPMVIAVDNIATYEDKWSDEQIMAGMSTKEILAMVHALPDGYRIVFNLYVFEDKDHKEIGELLGISESTSKSQLHRARTILKKKIMAIK